MIRPGRSFLGFDVKDNNFWMVANLGHMLRGANLASCPKSG
jgi:hypothetical protein